MKKWVPITILFGLWLYISLRTYVSGTQLLGWDNFAIELNPLLNLRRSLYAVWQEYQGLGLSAGMGHSADLVRSILYLMMSWILPLNMLRWVWILAMLLIGPLGMYILVYLLTQRRLSAFTSSLFYLCNPATIQIFSTPLEAFTTFYAFVPWLFWSALLFLQKGTRKSLITVIAVSFLASSAFVVQTLFIVYALSLTILVAIYVIKEKKLQRAFLLLTIILVSHIYWLGPVVYSAVTHSNVPVTARANRLATHDVELMNQSFGDLFSVASLRGWWFQNTDFDTSGSAFLLLDNWTEWLLHPLIGVIGVVIFIISTIGHLHSRQSAKYLKVGWISLLILCFFMLANNFIIIRHVYEWLSSNIPLFGQLFRAGYTKWSTVLAVVIAIGIGEFVLLTSKYALRAGCVAAAFCILLSVIVTGPLFRVGVINDSMKIELPSEYHSLFTFMNQQTPDGRIVHLPAESLWGWNYYDWGYRGSGFLWYGIEQPILDRAFDVWSAENETFYNQFSYALYGNDRDGVARVLDQYDVRYVLLDESVVDPGLSTDLFRYQETKQMMASVATKVFEEGKLTVWDLGVQGTNFVSAPATYTLVDVNTLYTRQDPIFQQYGTYLTSDNGIESPFVHLLREDAEVEYQEDEAIVKSTTRGGNLVIPGLAKGSMIELGYTASLGDEGITIDFDPLYWVNGNQKFDIVDIKLPISKPLDGYWVNWGGESIFVDNRRDVKGKVQLKVGDPISIALYKDQGYIEDVQSHITPGNTQMCWKSEVGENIATGIMRDSSFIDFTVLNAVACLAIPLSPASDDSLIRVELHHASSTGVRPDLCLSKDGGEYTCENSVVHAVTPSSDTVNRVVRVLPVAKGDRYWLDLIARPPATTNSLSAITYGIPEVSWYPKVETYHVTAEFWDNTQQDKTYEVMPGDIRITVPYYPNIYDLSKVGQLDPTNCDVLGRGGVGKVINERISEYYSDQYGAACDYVEAKNLTTLLPYLLRVKGTTLEGRSPKLYVHNTGNSWNVLEYLMHDGEFEHSFTLMPWTFTGSYSFNVETKSFGQMVVNRWEPFEIAYFPLELISNSHIQDGRANDKKSNLKVERVIKSGTWMYSITTKGYGPLVLSQGYDDGWLAWNMSNGTLLSHHRANGWANGWMVPEGVEQVVVFYWPQLLEFAGFLLLFATIVKITLMSE